MLSQFLNGHHDQRILPIWVESKHSSKEHIVYVRPHRFERDTGGGVVVYHICHFINILYRCKSAPKPMSFHLSTHPHAIPTVMIPKSPIRHHRTVPNHIRILLRYLHWRWPSKEVEVKHAAQDIVFQVRAVSIVDIYIHTI